MYAIGELTVKDGIEGENIYCVGEVNCPQVNADYFELLTVPETSSDIKEIYGGKVLITEDSKKCKCKIRLGILSFKVSSLKRFIEIKRNRKSENSRALKCEVIEADEISLENTEVKTVRGKRIIIGKNCAVDYIEYSESLDVDGGSTVKSSTKI